MKKFFYIVFAVVLLSACDTETGDQAEVAGDQAEVAGDPAEVAGDPAEVAGDPAGVAGKDQLSKEALNKKLFEGVLSGDFNAVKEALEQGAEVNAAQASFTPLHQAALRGHKEIVRLLLAQAGIDINATNNSGATALMFAASGGDKEIVELLLVQGGIDITRKNENGQTAYDYAVAADNEEIKQLLRPNVPNALETP